MRKRKPKYKDLSLLNSENIFVSDTAKVDLLKALGYGTSRPSNQKIIIQEIELVLKEYNFVKVAIGNFPRPSDIRNQSKEILTHAQALFYSLSNAYEMAIGEIVNAGYSEKDFVDPVGIETANYKHPNFEPLSVILDLLSKLTSSSQKVFDENSKKNSRSRPYALQNKWLVRYLDDIFCRYNDFGSEIKLATKNRIAFIKIASMEAFADLPITWKKSLKSLSK